MLETTDLIPSIIKCLIYITKLIIDLSKLTHYIRWRSRRLTAQEELTQDIATGLADELNASAVIVEVTTTHFCEVMRVSRRRQRRPPERALAR
ncbi:GTP cyclohydrolase I [Haladaptatus sp. DFWS20]|uniref:GTP cyclohydrolase I n=1 Tax=Haladaptatus sp. DFWS20 TaxID=3403467 RepID=UPI003EC01302